MCVCFCTYIYDKIQRPLSLSPIEKKTHNNHDWARREKKHTHTHIKHTQRERENSCMCMLCVCVCCVYVSIVGSCCDIFSPWRCVCVCCVCVVCVYVYIYAGMGILESVVSISTMLFFLSLSLPPLGSFLSKMVVCA